MEGVKEGDIVVPGDVLGTKLRFSGGPGTRTRGTEVVRIYSTLVGKVSITSAKSEDSKPVISVLHTKPSCLRNVPRIGMRTICRVINISERQAKVSVLCLEGEYLAEPFQGVVRREDIRAMEKDTVEMFHSFRPRDLLRARVVAYGEGQMYVLSTAENELGVVAAVCGCGCDENMLPVSWCEMQCRKTGKREKRKVAKVEAAIPVLV
jgi:exosome complex component CSL4